MSSLIPEGQETQPEEKYLPFGQRLVAHPTLIWAKDGHVDMKRVMMEVIAQPAEQLHE